MKAHPNCWPQCTSIGKRIGRRSNPLAAERRKLVLNQNLHNLVLCFKDSVARSWKVTRPNSVALLQKIPAQKLVHCKLSWKWWRTCQGRPGWPVLQGCCLGRDGTQSDPCGSLSALSGPAKVKLGLLTSKEDQLKEGVMV